MKLRQMCGNDFKEYICHYWNYEDHPQYIFEIVKKSPGFIMTIQMDFRAVNTILLILEMVQIRLRGIAFEFYCTFIVYQ